LNTQPIREPAVAGSFYPGERDSLLTVLDSLISVSEVRTRALGVLVPHAGYVYSGGVAGTVYSRILPPDRCFLLCPNHTGLGAPLGIMSAGAWRTPLGTVSIDRELAEGLMSLDPSVRESGEAHRMEHALEVQLPFLQYLAGDDFRFVPVAVRTVDLGALVALGAALAELIEAAGGDVLIVASSDMNHYESDSRTREKDRLAIDRLLERDPEGLHRQVLHHDISMCGFGPATSMLSAANRLGASQAELVDYATSGDAFGERERVVGYAGVVIS
jgi:AmmeMemoRadiSam system protein B